MNAIIDYIIFSLGIYVWFVTPIIWFTNPDKYEDAKIELFKNKGLLKSTLVHSHTLIIAILISFFGYLKLNFKYFWLLFSLFYTATFLLSITIMLFGSALGYDNPKGLGIKFSNRSKRIKRMKINKSTNFIFFFMWLLSWLNFE